MHQPIEEHKPFWSPLKVILLLVSLFLVVGGVFVTVTTVRLFKEFTQTSPVDFDRAVDLAQEGQYEKALVHVDKALEVHPEFSESHRLKGYILNSLKRPELALESYALYIDLNPKDIDGYLEQSMLLKELNRYDDAIRILDSAPTAPEIHWAKSDVYYRQGMLKEAIGCMDQAISLDSENPRLYNSRGFASYQNGDFEQAGNDYARALELDADDPDDAMVYNNRAYLQLAYDKADEAMADVTTALELSPNNPMILDTQGDVYKYMKEYENAIESYGKAMKFEPDNFIYYQNRALVYRLVGNVVAAEADEAKVVELQGDLSN